MIDSDALALGKAPPELLAALAGAADRDLLQGPGIGRDAAIIDWGDRALVATADPITFVDSGAARLAVAINANDILAVGAEPRWLLATVLAPVATSRAELRELLDSLREACDEAQIALVGGHTEVTDAVTRTIVSCALIGVAPRGEIVLSDGAQAGDFVLQAGAAAVEGTALLGHHQLLDEPGVSIAAAARALRGIAGVHAMHDVTEGGIATAAGELAEAAGWVSSCASRRSTGWPRRWTYARSAASTPWACWGRGRCWRPSRPARLMPGWPRCRAPVCGAPWWGGSWESRLRPSLTARRGGRYRASRRTKRYARWRRTAPRARSERLRGGPWSAADGRRARVTEQGDPLSSGEPRDAYASPLRPGEAQ